MAFAAILYKPAKFCSGLILTNDWLLIRDVFMYLSGRYNVLILTLRVLITSRTVFNLQTRTCEGKMRIKFVKLANHLIEIVQM